MATVLRVPDHSGVVLDNVSWQTYVNLLEDLAERSAPRLTFDRGVLEIMSPTAEHEELNRTLAFLVEIFAVELGLDVLNLGSATFNREDVERGFEPDSCFYVRNASCVKGKRRLDLAVDPPPDLVIEIDITSPSIRKAPIYAQLGVPEVWRYHDGELHVSRLEGTGYVTSERSIAFPLLTAAKLSELLAKSRTSTRPELVESFRAWIQSARKLD